MKPCSFAVTLMMVVTLVAVSSASADDATEFSKLIMMKILARMKKARGGLSMFNPLFPSH